MHGAQADETLDGGTPDDDTLGDERQGHGDGSDGLEVKKLRRLRLSGFLRDLVRREGKVGAAGSQPQDTDAGRGVRRDHGSHG